MDRRIREYQTTIEAVRATHFQVDLRLRPANGMSLEEATVRTLLISSLGTIKPLSYEPGYERGLARFSIGEAGGYILIQENESGAGLVTLALPLHLVSERESLTGLMQLLASGAEYAYTAEYWVERVALPDTFIDRFTGPRFGVAGIRSVLGVYGRPPLGLVLKPRFAVSIDTLTRVAKEALRGGCDFICDDVLFMDPGGDLSFERRVARMVEVARDETARAGEKKSYFCNVVASPQTAMAFAVHAIAEGVDGLIANAFAMGVGALEDFVAYLDGEELGVPVISTNMGVGVMSRGTIHDHGIVTQTGISDATVAKLCRLAGADGIHTGTVGGECYGEMEWNRTNHAIAGKMRGIAPSIAVAAGDLGLKLLWPNISSLGPEVIIEVESGVINYPDGVEAGARAFRTFLERLDPIDMDDAAAETVIAELAAGDVTIGNVLDTERCERQ